MKFRTEVLLNSSEVKMGIQDKIFSIGSCFSTEMAELLEKGQLQTLNNPFGTVFNPYSINRALQSICQLKYYTEEDLILYDEEMISLDHHSSFNSRDGLKTLQHINQNIEQAHQFLKTAQWAIVTYGTAFIYEFLPQQKLVANCHKIPNKFFQKRLLTHEEILQSIQNTIQSIRQMAGEKVQILFSISPVRHTKDGMVENQWSKARLINALHEAISEQSNCYYLPIYEIMMDDLRDYRFYKEDMIHPSNQAVNYIFEKFSEAFISEEAKSFMEENFKIHTALNHKTNDVHHPKHQAFLNKIKERIAHQQTKVKHQLKF